MDDSKQQFAQIMYSTACAEEIMLLKNSLVRIKHKNYVVRFKASISKISSVLRLKDYCHCYNNKHMIMDFEYGYHGQKKKY